MEIERPEIGQIVCAADYGTLTLAMKKALKNGLTRYEERHGVVLSKPEIQPVYKDFTGRSINCWEAEVVAYKDQD